MAVIRHVTAWGYKKYKIIDAELCRVVVSKGYLLVDFSRADSICFASPLIFLPGLEGPQRKWKGLVFLKLLNTDTQNDLSKISMALQTSDPEAPSTYSAQARREKRITGDSEFGLQLCLGALGSDMGDVLCL